MVDQIDIEKLAAQQGRAEGTGYSALPGLVRELVRTPAFKELLMMHLRDMNPENARELVRIFLWEDPGFSMGVMGALPKMVSWFAEAIAELGVQLSNLPATFLSDALSLMSQDMDREGLRSIPAAYAPLIKNMLEQRSGTVDFGKIRVRLTSFFESRREALQGEAEMPDVIMMANLMGVVPLMLNYVLRFLAWHLASIDMPPEILANFLFQLIEDIDKHELGELLNAMAGLTISLHQGNLVLGRHEPRFKEVATRFSKGLAESVDKEKLKEAATSFVEDGKVIGEVIASYIYATPESTAQMVKTLYAAFNAVLRTAAETGNRLTELPPEVVADLAEGFEQGFEARELGRIINTQAVLFNKFCEENPDMVSELLKKVFSAVDPEQLASAGKKALLQARDAALADPDIGARLQPEAIGRSINTSLASFNRFSGENPGLFAEKVSQTLAVVDARELRKAVDEMVIPLMRAFLKNTAVLRAMVMPVIRGTLRSMGEMGKNLVTFKRSKK
jgi:hypothetical protein